MTALVFAAPFVRTEVVTLLRKRVRPSLRDTHCVRVAELAEQQGTEELAALLRKAPP